MEHAAAGSSMLYTAHTITWCFPQGKPNQNSLLAFSPGRTGSLAAAAIEGPEHSAHSDELRFMPALEPLLGGGLSSGKQ